MAGIHNEEGTEPAFADDSSEQKQEDRFCSNLPAARSVGTSIANARSTSGGTMGPQTTWEYEGDKEGSQRRTEERQGGAHRGDEGPRRALRDAKSWEWSSNNIKQWKNHTATARSCMLARQKT